MKSLIGIIAKNMKSFFTNPIDDGEAPKNLTTVWEFIAEEIPWLVPAIISACEQWLPDDKKKYAWIVSIALLLFSVLFRYWQKRHGTPKTKVSRKKKISIRVVALMLALIICCGSYFGKTSEVPPQTEVTTPTEVTAVDEDIYGWDEIKTAMPGQTIYFGEYTQHTWTDDKQEIAWLVLAREDGKLLLMSKYCLDCKQYNESGEACTWETSSIRSWLNNSFLVEAFDTYEQARIATTSVGAHANPEIDSSYAGNKTDDKIFLLSIEELTYYFKTPEERQAFPTEIAVHNGAGYDRDIEGGPCWWWLRTPGQDNSRATDVKSGGAINYEGYGVASRNFSVRPALWLDVSDD